TLLASWETLKEVFRIPKKLRIEQMKEHEQEANRSYRALGIAETEDSNKRYIDAPKDKEKERFKKEKRSRHRDPNDPDSALLKAERRRLFEAQVAQDTIDKRNYERQLEAIHIAKCKYFQLDPRVTSYRDVPFSVSPLTGQWYSKDNEMIPTPPSHAHIKPPQELPTNPDEYDLPPMDLPPQWKFAIDPRGKLYYYHVKIRIPQWDPPIKILPLREEQTPCVDDIKMELCDDSENDTKDDSLLHSNLSNDFDSDKDDDSEESSDAIDSSEDELMQRRQQLLNSFQSNQTDLDISANLAVEISAMATTSSMDDSADQSFNLDLSLMHSSGKKKNRDGLATERLISPRTDEERIQSKIEMQKYKANKEKLRRRRENAKLRTHGLSEPSRKLKKLTDGLPVVSQQDDEMDDTDEEEEANVSDLEAGVLDAKFVDELDGIKSDKVSNRPDNQKVRLDALRSNRKVPKRKRPEPEPVPHNSNEAAKRIKEKFCAEMSGVIVQHLGPYRRDDCRIGRITNNEDFKHLARKLTHFVMLKELKHCDNTVTVLEVSDSVRAKSKEFIRKYMAKFGEVYVKPENDPEYKEFCNT
ncbi:Histone-lysine N-methyltransferase SETD2, partial [Pseudolycoriella hygida]